MPTQRDPRMLAWPDLVWSHFSRPRFGNFEERLDAAAAAGFAGIGLYLYASINQFAWQQVLLVLSAILVIVIASEALSAWIRGRIS